MGDVQFIGLCRFSYVVSEGGFQVARDTAEGLRALLYDPDRLAVRLFYFEHVTLPALRQQTDPDFKLIVLTGVDFPEPFRSRLEGLVADIPQIELVYELPRPHGQVCKEIFKNARDPNAKAVAEFRLDDDDAVAVNYIQRTRNLYSRIRPLLNNRGRAAIDDTFGARIATVGDEVQISALRAQRWSAALTLFCKPNDPGCVMDFAHMHVWRHMPVLSMNEQMMHVRGDHGLNDSDMSRSPYFKKDMDPAELERRLRARFAIDMPTLRQAWSDLRAKL